MLCAVHHELLAHDRDHGLLVLLDRDRVLDRERRARPARAEADDRAVDDAGELVDVLAVVGAGLADLRAGLDRDRVRAVAREVVAPDARDELPRAPGPVGAQPDRQPAERAVDRKAGALSSPAGAAVGRRTQMVVGPGVSSMPSG